MGTQHAKNRRLSARIGRGRPFVSQASQTVSLLPLRTAIHQFFEAAYPIHAPVRWLTGLVVIAVLLFALFMFYVLECIYAKKRSDREVRKHLTARAGITTITVTHRLSLPLRILSLALNGHGFNNGAWVFFFGLGSAEANVYLFGLSKVCR